MNLKIENRTGKARLDESVTEQSMNELIDKMATLYGDDAVRNELKIGDCVAVSENALESLEITINSPGGSVKQGYRAYKTIKELRARGVKVTALIVGQAASMGSVIAMAADEIKIDRNAKMMIHDASLMAYGNANQLKKDAEFADKVSNALAALYSEKVGKSPEFVRELMKSETWMNAEESLENGFADDIFDAKEGKMETELDKLLAMSNKPDNGSDMSILDRLISPSDAEAKSRIEALETEISNHSAEIESFKAKLATAETALQEASNLAVENRDLKAKAETIPALEAKITTLESEKEINEGKIADAAAKLLAAQGHNEPLKLDEKKSEKSPKPELFGLARLIEKAKNTSN
jgi:ATP-dependent Clp endopeptidase proteolytic subunit ClpP